VRSGVLPKVSVLTAAHNYEEFVAAGLRRALSQDYLADRVELIVVDDGSADGTADVVRGLAETNPGRIRLIQQENAGKNAAIATARAQADGDLLALLDADDVWLPTKLSRQAQVLTQRPEVGLVFCDMRIVDSAERVVRPTLYQPGDVDLGRMYARILQSNVAYSSTIVFRSHLFIPWPDEIEDCDWWIALCAAERTEIGYIDEPLALYRQHGSNVLNGTTGEDLIPLRRRQLRFQLWALRHMDLDQLTADDLLRVWSGPEYFFGTAKQAIGTHFVELVSITDADRIQADEMRDAAERSRLTGDLVGAARWRLRALAWDPCGPDALADLRDAVAQAQAAVPS
jgi:glycosyltransferase involved in cell wall biosynthesis